MASDLQGTPVRRASQLLTPSTLRKRQPVTNSHPPLPHFSLSSPTLSNASLTSNNGNQKPQPVHQLKLDQAFPSIHAPGAQEHRNGAGVSIHRIPSTNSSIDSATSEIINPNFNENGDKRPNNGMHYNNNENFSPIRKSYISDPGSETDSTHHQSLYEGVSGSSSAVIANAVAQAVSQVHTEAQREIAELRKQIHESQLLLQDRDSQLKEQNDILKDLESTVVEFQDLSIREAAKQLAQNSPNPDGTSGPNYIIEELKRQHQKELQTIIEDKDRRIATLKIQFDEKRNEFRKTIDALQLDLQDSNSVYVREIEILQMKLGEAEKVTERVKELETMIQDIDVSQTNSQMAEQETRAQLQRLADAENQILEKGSRINDLQEQLSEARSKLEAIQKQQGSPIASRRTSLITDAVPNSAVIAEIESLKKEVLDLRNTKVRLEQELEAEREKREQAERELANIEGMLEDKIFKESDLERQLNEMNMQVTKLENDLDSKAGTMSTSTPNDFIASGTPVAKSASSTGGSSAIASAITTPAHPVVSRTSVVGFGMPNSRENSHHKRFSLTGLSIHTDSNPESLSNSPSTSGIESLLDELPINSNSPTSVAQRAYTTSRTSSSGSGKLQRTDSAANSPVAELNDPLKYHMSTPSKSRYTNSAAAVVSPQLLSPSPGIGPPPVGSLPSFSSPSINTQTHISSQASAPTAQLLSDSRKNSLSDLVVEEESEAEEELLTTPDAAQTLLPKKPIDLADGREKWCGLCERDGHDSLECPFENDGDLEF